MRLHVRQLDSGGAPLILVHGLGVSGAIWQSFARRLAPAWSAIAPDLRGHGQSDKPLAGYAPEDYAGDILALAETLGGPGVPLVGHSLGALVAFAAAVVAPESVTALVLLDPPLDATRQNPDVQQVYRLRHAPPGELEQYLGSRVLAPIFRQAADAVFETYLAAPQGALWAWDAAPSVNVPGLVVQADPTTGGVLGDEAAKAFVARLPQGTLVKILEAPHALHATHPGAVADAVLPFLDAH